MAIILLILIAIIIWLLIKIYDYKKINTKLAKQNNELAERIKLLIGTSQFHSENLDEKSSQGSEENKYASIPPTPFNEKNAAAWKKYEDEQSEVGTKYRKVQESQPDMINNLVDHLMILSTPTNMIQIQISVCVNYFY